MDVVIRPARREDAENVAEIYNHAIRDRQSTFDSFPVSAGHYARFFRGDPASGLVVAEVGPRIAGWASVIPISDRWAYRYTCLASTYVHKDFRGQGIGRQLKAAQIAEAERLGYHSIIGEALKTNLPSISVNLEFGFRILGEIQDAGYRDGQWINLVIMQKLLKEQDMPQRRVVFSIITDDIEKSVKLYRDALGLDMRPLSHPIVMFPIGDAEFQVCLRELAREQLGWQLTKQPAGGLLISLRLDSTDQLHRARDAALDCDVKLLSREGNSHAAHFEDFNGVIWMLSAT